MLKKYIFCLLSMSFIAQGFVSEHVDKVELDRLCRIVHIDKMLETTGSSNSIHVGMNKQVISFLIDNTNTMEEVNALCIAYLQAIKDGHTHTDAMLMMVLELLAHNKEKYETVYTHSRIDRIMRIKDILKKYISLPEKMVHEVVACLTDATTTVEQVNDLCIAYLNAIGDGHTHGDAMQTIKNIK